MKLLSMSTSFAGGRNGPGRYKMADQGLLPKFAAMGRPVSLAPVRLPDEPVPKQAAHRTPAIPMNPPQQKSARAAQKRTEPVEAIAPALRAAVCVNANSAPTNWFRLGTPPAVNRSAGRPTFLMPAQGELSLDSVKPVRNDLSDSDLQIVQAKPEMKPDALKPTRPHSWKPELTGLAWSRLTARFFNSERVRA